MIADLPPRALFDIYGRATGPHCIWTRLFRNSSALPLKPGQSGGPRHGGSAAAQDLRLPRRRPSPRPEVLVFSTLPCSRMVCMQAPQTEITNGMISTSCLVSTHTQSCSIRAQNECVLTQTLGTWLPQHVIDPTWPSFTQPAAIDPGGTVVATRPLVDRPGARRRSALWRPFTHEHHNVVDAMRAGHVVPAPRAVPSRFSGCSPSAFQPPAPGPLGPVRPEATALAKLARISASISAACRRLFTSFSTEMARARVPARTPYGRELMSTPAVERSTVR